MADEIQFQTSGKVLVSVSPDGKIELGDGVSPSEAAQEMFEILSDLFKQSEMTNG